MANVGSLQWQPSLLDAANSVPSFDAAFVRARRIHLERRAWVELCPSWVSAADTLFTEIVACAPWERRRVHMYDRLVDEPRLTAWYGRALEDDSLPPVVRAIADALSQRYDRVFDGVGAALYRDGRDSVAWHGDRIPPELIEPVVAIVSLGSPRRLRLRSQQRRGDTRTFTLLPGDLFVMGGTTQRTWQHSVPKVKSAGPRLSMQFRHSR
jgi:alkylated DNA repair dioxygenase AlkB